MAYSTTLYHKTGFTVSNPPATLAVLQAAATTTTTGPDLEIVQPYPLTYIDIPGTYPDIMDVDYVKVGDYIYAATPYPMPAGDVVELALVFEPIPTFAGAFTVVSGIIERTTQHDDEFGEYCQEDPLTAPMDPLEIDAKLLFNATYWGGVSWDYITVCATMVDFTKATETEEGSGDYTFPGVTFTDPYNSENSVTVPSIPGNSGDRKTTFKISIGGTETELPISPGTVLVPLAQFEKVKDLLRSLGAEGSVSLYNLPTFYGSSFPTDTDITYYTQLEATDKKETGFSINYATVTNKRVLYGQYNQWGLLSASGSKKEYAVEDILEEGGETPVVVMNADLRPEGKPYFRFRTYKGNTSPDLFFLCAIPGAPWEQLPIVWTGASGSWIAQQNQAYQMLSGEAAMQNEMKEQQIAYNRKQWDYAAGKGEYPGFPSLGKDENIAVTGPYRAVTVMQDAFSGFFNDLKDAKRAAQDYARTTNYQIAAYNSARENELLNYGYSQSAVAPELSMPYQSDLARDVMGNGVILYRYRYSANDVKRIDKLLTMYGYRISRAATITDIYPTGKTSGFVYFQAQGITLSSDTVPKWALELLEAQLTAGARIWWQKPDASLYG